MAYTPNAAALVASNAGHTSATGATVQLQLDQLDTAVAARALDNAVLKLTGVQTASGKKTFSDGLDAGSDEITSVATPTTGTSAANKSYVDNAVAGTSNQLHAARVVSRTNRALTGFPSVDDVTLTDNERILLVGQTTPAQNGPWLVHAGAWTRPPDFASGTTERGASIFVTSGTLDGNSGWLMNNATDVTVDTTAQTWVQINGMAEIIPGAGLIAEGTNGIRANAATISRTGNATAAYGQVNLVDATSAAVTITLPAVSANQPVITVKKTDASANAVTVTPASGTIDGAVNFVLSTRYHSVDLACDGTNWFLV